MGNTGAPIPGPRGGPRMSFGVYLKVRRIYEDTYCWVSVHATRSEAEAGLKPDERVVHANIDAPRPKEVR